MTNTNPIAKLCPVCKGRGDIPLGTTANRGCDACHGSGKVEPAKIINIFATGNVLDPHITIEGKCRACGGSGWGPDGCFCTVCFGKGKATAQVRLSDLVALVAPVAEFVGRGEAQGTVSTAPKFETLKGAGVQTWKLVAAGTEQEEFEGTGADADLRFDCQIEVVPGEPCSLYWRRGEPDDWLAMQRWTPEP